MADKVLKLHELCKILHRYDCWEDTSRGKGGHMMFFRRVDGKVLSNPYSGEKEVMKCYVKQIRRKLKLTADDGVSDEEFYG